MRTELANFSSTALTNMLFRNNPECVYRTDTFLLEPEQAIVLILTVGGYWRIRNLYSPDGITLLPLPTDPIHCALMVGPGAFDRFHLEVCLSKVEQEAKRVDRRWRALCEASDRTYAQKEDARDEAIEEVVQLLDRDANMIQSELHYMDEEMLDDYYQDCRLNHFELTIKSTEAEIFAAVRRERAECADQGCFSTFPDMYDLIWRKIEAARRRARDEDEDDDVGDLAA